MKSAKRSRNPSSSAWPAWSPTLLATGILAHVYFLSHDDEALGGLWAVIATVFVLRGSYEQSMMVAFSRVMATLVSFAICLVYLVFLPLPPLGPGRVLVAVKRPRRHPGSGAPGRRRHRRPNRPNLTVVLAGRGRNPAARLATTHLSA